MKLAICGPGRAGKDTAAEFLATISPLRYTAGTSYWARHLVFDWMQRDGFPQYADAHACWLDRHNHRQLWAEIIGQYNANDPVKLYRDCLADQDLLTGIRWRHEQSACKGAGLCDLWIWIDRPGCDDPTCQVRAEDCDITILNHGTLEEFHERLRRFASILRL
jgi:hypothetical protein